MDFTAFVLMNVRTGKLDEVVKELKALNGVTHAYPTTGPFDVIVSISVPNLGDIRKLVTEMMHHIDGVEKTTTCIVAE